MEMKSGATGQTVLSCSGLHRYLGKGEGRVHALRGVSFAVEAGTTYAVEGPSGCGKSTLLYTIGLLDRPEEGEVRVGNRELSRADDELRTRVRLGDVGFVFQFHFLLAEFTALENVLLPMQRGGALSRSESRDRAAFLLDQVGLGDKTGRMANHLSGGEQQRVAVARALANSPSVILADEPTGNLDVTNTGVVVDLLVQLARENQQALVLVTHNSEVARRCDVRLSMRDGRFVGK